MTYHDNIKLISLAVNILSLLVIGITAFYIKKQAELFRKQISENHEWNRRKTTQEVLMDLSYGEFPNKVQKLKKEYGLEFSDKCNPYTKLAESLEGDKLKDFELIIESICNILESFCINMKNKIIDPEICYDYMSLIMTECYKFCTPFIEKRRKLYDDEISLFRIRGSC